MSSSAPQPSSAAATPGSREVTFVTDNLDKPSLDDRSYRVIRLGNELEILLARDEKADKASASMDVNVGAYSDELDMPGMAHAVEHLLFLGTKTFPEENGYNQYLSANSGHANAYTRSTSTNYYFEVSAKPNNDEPASETNPSPLRGALDRFSKFFIEPLFLSSAVDRELQAVDSENKKNLQIDGWRTYQLEKSMSNPKHPNYKFSTGNLEQLKTLPEARGINVRDKFIEFHSKHYSANRMKLVVLGREPLDVLQKWAVELFSAVPNKNLQQNRWPGIPLHLEDALATVIFAKPVMDKREMTLSFPLLDETDLYEIQPSSLLAHLFGHEGPGSLFLYLKQKGWASALSSGASSTGPGSDGTFVVNVYLTEEGLDHYNEITEVVFQYISLLRSALLPQSLHDELVAISEMNFKYKQKIPPSRFTSSTSAQMQEPVPREWLLRGDATIRKFDAELISKILERFTPENLRMMVLAQKIGGWNQKEKFYGTEYRLEKISKDIMERFRAAASVNEKDRIQDLHLPHPNNFIPTNLEVERRDIKDPATEPKLIRNDKYSRVWWKKDDTFWMPLANLTVSFRNNLVTNSPQNNVKARLVFELVKDALEAYSYDASLANLNYDLTIEARGFFIDVTGYNDKLGVLLEQVLKTLRDVEFKQDRFNIIKERIERWMKNNALQMPVYQVQALTDSLIMDRTFVTDQLVPEIGHVSLEQVQQFHQQLLSQFHFELQAYGNIHRDEALQIADLVQSTFKPRVLPEPQWDLIRCRMLPPGTNFVYEKTLKDPDSPNSCIEYWVNTGNRWDPVARSKTMLVTQLINEPAFDQLRTKEQLGYMVFTQHKAVRSSSYIRVLIQSEKTPQYLESRVDSFLAGMYDAIEKMPDAEFQDHKRSVVTDLTEKPKNLAQEISQYGYQIIAERYDFGLRKKEADHVQALTKSDILEFFKRHVSPASTERAKLSVHMLALDQPSAEEHIDEFFAGLKLDSSLTKTLKATLAQNTNRQDINNLKRVLSRELELPSDTVKKIAEFATAHQLPIIAHGNAPAVGPTYITDVRRFQGSLAISPATLSVKDISEYEDLEAKL